MLDSTVKILCLGSRKPGCTDPRVPGLSNSPRLNLLLSGLVTSLHVTLGTTPHMRFTSSTLDTHAQILRYVFHVPEVRITGGAVLETTPKDLFVRY